MSIQYPTIPVEIVSDEPLTYEQDYEWAVKRLTELEKAEPPSNGSVSEVTRLRWLIEHMKAVIGGRIPECLTCKDSGSVQCASGYSMCQECKGAYRNASK